MTKPILILGPRQSGKTTLAFIFARCISKVSPYIGKVDAEQIFISMEECRKQCCIFDEVKFDDIDKVLSRVSELDMFRQVIIVSQIPEVSIHNLASFNDKANKYLLSKNIETIFLK